MKAEHGSHNPLTVYVRGVGNGAAAMDTFLCSAVTPAGAAMIADAVTEYLAAHPEARHWVPGAGWPVAKREVGA